MDTPADQEQLYKIQLLQAFDLTVWNDVTVDGILTELYASMKNDKNLQHILSKLSQLETLKEILNKAEDYGTNSDGTNSDGTNTDGTNSDGTNSDGTNSDGTNTEFNNMMLFTWLFQYDFFDLFHMCIVDFKLNGTIREKRMNELLNEL